MKNIKISKKEYISIGILGCLLGILCFILIFGIKILDFTYDGWLLNDEIDLKQHYVGWCHFRNTPWKFPFGLIDSLSEPFSMSVVYTDSIPLFAVFFKLFRAFLPERFQYFGLFGLICFGLQGAFSAILIRIFTDKKQICAMGSIFFIISTPILQRLFFHTALSAQWLILLALIIWFSYDINKSIKRNIILFGSFGFICISIHSYYVFMCGIIFVFMCIENYIRSIKGDFYDNEPGNIQLSVKKRKDAAAKNGIISLLSFSAAAFINLYILGGFYGQSSVSGGGFGEFNANMNSFINSLGFSKFFPALKLFGYFQYEGAAYLGAGIFLLIAVIAVCFLVSLIASGNKRTLANNNSENTEKNKGILFEIKQYFASHYRITLVLICIAFTFLAACFPNFDFSDVKIVHIPLPGFMYKILGVCRTNGRFIWIAFYLIILSSIVLFIPYFEKPVFKIIFMAAFLIQLMDFSNYAKARGTYFKIDHEYSSMWTPFEQFGIMDNKNRFIFMYNDSDIMMDTGFYCYLNNMSQNIFYYARPIDDAIENRINDIKEEIKAGNIDSSAIYVFKEDDIDENIKDALLGAGATEYFFKGHVMYAK